MEEEQVNICTWRVIKFHKVFTDCGVYCRTDNYDHESKVCPFCDNPSILIEEVVVEVQCS